MVKRIVFVVFFLGFALLTYTQQDMEFKEIYYTNKNKERITGIPENAKTIYLVIVTENGKGKSVDIEMNEDDPPVIYKNKYYSVGDTFQYILKNDIQYIKFRLFDISKKKHRKLAQIEDADG